MKLLFIFTGGTIGSTQNGNIISTDSERSYKLIGAYERAWGIDFDYDTVEPYVGLSENNTGLHIKALAMCVRDSLGKGYDGIIVTHGTDTLQYSAAALGYCLGLDIEPVCLVSANAPIENEGSNGLDNLHGAVRFIEGRRGRGVFAVYRNSTCSTVRVHRGVRLLGAKAYSDDLSSLGKCVYGHFDSEFNFIKNPLYSEREDEMPPLEPSALSETNGMAINLFSYPGMSYPKIGCGVSYIILNTYHSGTANTSSREAREFFAEAKRRGIPVYATGVSGGPRYSSAECFEELGITPVVSISPVSAYIKLWLIYAMGADPKKLLGLSLSGDIAE